MIVGKAFSIKLLDSTLLSAEGKYPNEYPRFCYWIIDELVFALFLMLVAPVYAITPQGPYQRSKLKVRTPNFGS